MEKNLQKLNQHDRLRLWTERVAACRSCGMQVRQWCGENGIAEKTYYYWQRRVYEAVKAEAQPVFAEVVTPEDGLLESLRSFTPVLFGSRSSGLL